jgi:hypothetical protein
LRAATELAGVINNDAAAPVCNIADNIDNNEQLNDAAPVENVGNHANNNDPHDVVDEQSDDAAAPVRNIADSIDNNEQRISTAPVDNGTINNDEAAPPVCNIADNIDDNEQLNDAAPVENVGNQANNNDPHDVVDKQSNDTSAPVHNIADSVDNNKQLSDAAPVQNVSNHAINNDRCEVADGQLIETVVGNGSIETHYAAIHNNGTTLTAPTIKYSNDQLELRDRRMCDLEAKIVDLESKMTALSDTVGDWPRCTSVGDQRCCNDNQYSASDQDFVN